MEENKDVTIQQLLDEKSSREENILGEMANDVDFKAYNLLYGFLKQKPEQGLSHSFKSSVIKRIEIEKKQASDTKFYWFFSIISLVGICVIATMFYILKDSLIPLLAVIVKFKGFIIIIILAILLSNIVDQRLIKNHG